MRLLFAGNSHASCLKRAHDSHPGLLSKCEVFFYVTTGGAGPLFTIKDNKLNVIGAPVTRVSPEEVRGLPLNHYDVIVISALGYVDGGFCYNNVITKQGLLAAYRPKPNKVTNRYLSKNCYIQVISSSLRAQHGVQFLLNLRASFGGRIIVQPLPVMSEIVKGHPDWALNQMYDDPIGAHEFFSRIRDEFLANICKEVSAELLPYPIASWRNDLFAPAEFMSKDDGLHTLDSYGEMVIRQIASVL